MEADIAQIIKTIKEGYSEVSYQGRRYGLSKRTLNSNKSYKIYAQELGGNDFISLNFYCMTRGNSIKPCEMPEQKVVDFLIGFEAI